MNTLNTYIHRPVLVCCICGDVARGMNFDVMSCTSCKAFFRRNALLPSHTLRCRRKSNCIITKKERPKCAACRLKKCFQCGMKPYLIRSLTQHQLPSPRPLDLLRNDRSRLKREEWNLLSNVVNTYDGQNYVSRVKCVLNELLSLPPKLRVKLPLADNFMNLCVSSVEPLLRLSPHFQSLSTDTRRTLVAGNGFYTGIVNSCLIDDDTNFMDNPFFEVSCSKVFNIDLLEPAVSLCKRYNWNKTVTKVMIFIIAFSSNCSIIQFDSSYNIEASESSAEIIHIQDIFATLLWKYLLYQYGFKEAVHRYSSLIMINVSLLSVLENIFKSQDLNKMVDTAVTQLEHSLVIED